MDKGEEGWPAPTRGASISDWTTQLRDVRGLPLHIKRSSEPASCNLFIPLSFHFLSRNLWISLRAPWPFDSHKL